MKMMKIYHRAHAVRILLLTGVIIIVLILGFFASVQMGWFRLTMSRPATSSANATPSENNRFGTDNSATPSNLNHGKLDEALAAASQYINTDKMGEAEKILEALQKDNPDNPAVLRQLYELRLYQNNYQAAYDIIRKLIDIGDTDPETYFNAGTIAFQIGKITQAAVHYEQATTLDPVNPKYPLYLAQIQIKLHEYTKAKINLLKVINLNGSVHEAFGTLAQIALIENKLDTAQQNIDRARQLAPNFIKWRILEAKIIRRKGNPEEALARLNAITNPKYQYLTELVEEKAQCWAMLGKPESAAKEFVKQLNQYPGAWRSAVEASRYFLTAGDLTKGKLWYSYAKKRAPENARELIDLRKQYPQLATSDDDTTNNDNN